ncbi:SGNH/GDSL hydrolase family protein [Coraliomargarita parva]|uniref:SGNH/GDSL hydrolase family protein n=1 Tax=Coraliomargarita parva TaxID=3014050 RepID=UPI0022B5C2C0|nr:SGNH/GDSL hydrolase family protein [Coraliomargarita parva]
MKRSLLLVSFCLGGLLPAALLTAASQEVAANADDFLYEGRTVLQDAGVLLTWPGSTVKFAFEGGSLDLVLDDERGENFYQVIVNGNEADAFVIDCEPGEHSYTVPASLLATENEVVLFKRNEGFQGKTVFEGIRIDEAGRLLPPPAKPVRKIEFYGDSITCGMGNLAPEDAGDKGMHVENNYMAYGAITARQLEAEYRCIAKSGIGIIKSWFPLVMPEMYDRVTPSDAGSRWDFSQWTPDVVVVNLFQNDKWLVGRLDPVPTGPDIIAAYKQFIASLRTVYPEAQIVCALGSMDATAPDSQWPGYIETAVAEMEAEGDTKLSTCFFPFDGFRKHPRVRHHQRNADILSAHIRAIMDW